MYKSSLVSADHDGRPDVAAATATAIAAAVVVAVRSYDEEGSVDLGGRRIIKKGSGRERGIGVGDEEKSAALSYNTFFAVVVENRIVAKIGHRGLPFVVSLNSFSSSCLFLCLLFLFPLLFYSVFQALAQCCMSPAHAKLVETKREVMEIMLHNLPPPNHQVRGGRNSFGLVSDEKITDSNWANTYLRRL